MPVDDMLNRLLIRWDSKIHPSDGFGQFIHPGSLKASVSHFAVDFNFDGTVFFELK